MYEKYWEPKYPDKRITTNDTCCLFSLVYPKLFSFKRIDCTVDTQNVLGKTDVTFNENGKILFVDDLNKPEFLEFLTSQLEKLKELKLNLSL